MLQKSSTALTQAYGSANRAVSGLAKSSPVL